MALKPEDGEPSHVERSSELISTSHTVGFRAVYSIKAGAPEATNRVIT